jgi:hypothetical protein
MQGLRQKGARLRTRRARYSHARTLAPGEGEGLAPHATLGHTRSGGAGGGSTAFSGDRAQRARRKAVDAPEAPDPQGGGASAPLPKHHHSFASWQSMAVVCARVVAQLGRRGPMSALAAGEWLRGGLTAAGLLPRATPPPLPGELSNATAGRFYPRHRTTRFGP